MSRSLVWTALVRDRRGANAVEYTLCVGLACLAVLGGVRFLGERISDKARQQAECVLRLSCDAVAATASAADAEGNDHFTAAAPGAATALATSQPSGAIVATVPPPPSKDDPPIGDTDHTQEPLVYRAWDGRPFVGAQGDSLDIHPNDVMQGRLGDCYLMAAMAAVALRDPGAIREAIEVRKDGRYTVKLYERGWGGLRRHGVKVAPTFPVTKAKGTPVFAHTSDRVGDEGELWPMLVEKALAQKKGGYDAIEQGSAAAALEALTGREVRVSRHRTQDSWNLSFEELARAVESGQPVITASPRNDWGWEGPLFDSDKVVMEHTYYVTAVDRDKQTVTLRNPWGWSYGEMTLGFAEYKHHFSSLMTTESKATRGTHWEPFR